MLILQERLFVTSPLSMPHRRTLGRALSLSRLRKPAGVRRGPRSRALSTDGAKAVFSDRLAPARFDAPVGVRTFTDGRDTDLQRRRFQRVCSARASSRWHQTRSRRSRCAGEPSRRGRSGVHARREPTLPPAPTSRTGVGGRCGGFRRPLAGWRHDRPALSSSDSTQKLQDRQVSAAYAIAAWASSFGARLLV
jgi:hypothetical protein